MSRKIYTTGQKPKFSVWYLFIKCDQIRIVPVYLVTFMAEILNVKLFFFGQYLIIYQLSMLPTLLKEEVKLHSILFLLFLLCANVFHITRFWKFLKNWLIFILKVVKEITIKEITIDSLNVLRLKDFISSIYISSICFFANIFRNISRTQSNI